ncbi:MAG TPA: hypothetical protein VMM17_03065 [Gemmatimonadaceae bacterium]|nr:hypothetical protein [Gemmatimonadaceae bacterium]
MRYPGLTALLLALVAVAGCDELTELEPEAVAVRAAHALPPVSSSTTDFTVDVAVDNFSLETLFLNASCGWVIDRAEASVWVPAYIAPCPATETFIEIEPETTHSLTLEALVARRVDSEAVPPGTYRVRLALEVSYSRLRRQEVPEASRTSNEFVVQ